MLTSENNVGIFDYAEWTECRVIKTHARVHNSLQWLYHNVCYVPAILVDDLEVFVCWIIAIYVIAAEKCDGEPFTRQDAEPDNEVPLWWFSEYKVCNKYIRLEGSETGETNY